VPDERTTAKRVLGVQRDVPVQETALSRYGCASHHLPGEALWVCTVSTVRVATKNQKKTEKGRLLQCGRGCLQIARRESQDFLCTGMPALHGHARTARVSDPLRLSAPSPPSQRRSLGLKAFHSFPLAASAHSLGSLAPWGLSDAPGGPYALPNATGLTCARAPRVLQVASCWDAVLPTRRMPLATHVRVIGHPYVCGAGVRCCRRTAPLHLSVLHHLLEPTTLGGAAC